MGDIGEYDEDDRRLDFANTLFSARRYFEDELRRCVPEDIVFKVRGDENGVHEIGPGEHNYASLRETFCDEVSSASAVQVLISLYRFRVRHIGDIDGFLDLLQSDQRPPLIEGRVLRIRNDFPRIDQTSIVALNSNLRKTTVVNRLEDLERIGFVKRSVLTAPDRKHAEITDKGIEFLRRVIDETKKRMIVSLSSQHAPRAMGGQQDV